MDTKKIGERIRNLREKAGETKRFLARELGCGYSTVCSWEYGLKVPEDKMKIRIAEHFRVPINIFFDENYHEN